MKYFSRFGSIEDLRVIKDSSNSNKTYGFVLYKRKSDYEKVFAQGTQHKVDKIIVDCKPSMLKEELKEMKRKKRREERNKLQLTNSEVLPIPLSTKAEPFEAPELAIQEADYEPRRRDAILTSHNLGNLDLEMFTKERSLSKDGSTIGTHKEEPKRNNEASSFNFSKFAVSINVSQVFKNSELSGYSKNEDYNPDLEIDEMNFPIKLKASKSRESNILRMSGFDIRNRVSKSANTNELLDEPTCNVFEEGYPFELKEESEHLENSPDDILFRLQDDDLFCQF